MNIHNPKAIGILGGTFDPIHLGHIQLAEQIIKNLPLQKIIFIPCFEPPHCKEPIASPKHRLNMLNIALEDYPNFIADDREIKRQGTSYTVDTLQTLKNDYPNTPLCLIMGSDAFSQLSTWHHWEKLNELAHLIVVNRSNTDAQTTPEITALLEKNETKNPNDLNTTISGKIYQLFIKPIPISSTQIRNQLNCQEKLKNMLPEKIYEYILAEKLFK